MKIILLSLFPEALSSYLRTSILARALEKKAWSIEIYNLADFSVRNTRRSDDRPYGGFPGTIIAPEPCEKAMDMIHQKYGVIPWIAPDPRGDTLAQKTLETFSKVPILGILCGHYEGIDERVFEEYAIQKISL
jgi:tRNA (guanine37-N1)-methyltransferase